MQLGLVDVHGCPPQQVFDGDLTRREGNFPVENFLVGRQHANFDTTFLTVVYELTYLFSRQRTGRNKYFPGAMSLG